jgi:hypothetical protein
MRAKNIHEKLDGTFAVSKILKNLLEQIFGMPKMNSFLCMSHYFGQTFVKSLKDLEF